MPVIEAIIEEPRVAKRKARPPERPPDEGRDRLDLRIEPELRARADAARKRFGLSLSAYIRLALAERIERDEARLAGSG